MREGGRISRVQSNSIKAGRQNMIQYVTNVTRQDYNVKLVHEEKKCTITLVYCLCITYKIIQHITATATSILIEWTPENRFEHFEIWRLQVLG